MRVYWTDNSIEHLLGIWKGREIKSSALRQKAWQVKEVRNGNN